MKNLDVVTFGETMVLFNPETQGPLRHIHGFTKSIAGAESNVAIALANLGHKVGWFSKVGDDEFGRYIEFVIRGEGVDVSRLIKDEVNRTGIMFKETFGHTDPSVYYYREGSAASYIEPSDIDHEYICSARILHITGITPALSKSARQTVFEAIDIAKKNGVLVSFDPNIRLKLWSKEAAKKTLLQIMKKADIVFPGIDEANLLLGTQDPYKAIEKFHELGASVVALKIGAKGCIISDGSESVRVEGYEVTSVVDTVGAGDGFAAGFLSRYLDNFSLEEAGKFANGIGAMATQVKGDIEGFPTRRQLLRYIKEEEYIDR